jgi:hypothetical protein
VLRNFHQACQKKLVMSDLGIFSLGLGIFITYMFFLLRMIYRQHKAQERNDTNHMSVDGKIDKPNKLAS